MNVLFLTHRLPWAPNRGDRIRAYHLLQELSSFAHVSLFSLVHDAEEASHAGEIRLAGRVEISRVPALRNLVRGVARLRSDRPLTHSLLDAPDAIVKIDSLVRERPPDVVLAYCSGMARFALTPPLAGRPFVLDMVDVDSAKWSALAEGANRLRRWVYGREARTLSAFERDAARAARTVLVVSERERDALLALAPGADVVVISNGVDIEAFAPPGPPTRNPVVVFCGVMNYEPNVEGVRWFAREVWPRVKQGRPDARFVIAGSGPARAVRALGETDASIEVTGKVEAVASYLWRAAVSVAPLHTARGLQNKVLEALAAGLPVVVTSAVHAGLPAGPRAVCPVADDPGAFSEAVLALLAETPDNRRQRAATARIETLSWPSQLASLRGIVRKAIRSAR